MHVDPTYGPAAPEFGWVPAPRYLLRRSRVLDLTSKVAPGALLEIGCGPAVLLQEFARRGFQCTALESSAAALELAQRLAESAGVSIDFHAEPAAAWQGAFDMLFAFEVLEHIEDDRSALLQWFKWLRPGGHLVLSVPAHQRSWTARDEWAGHFRRYERKDLARIIRESGFELQRLECYGFPLANLTEIVTARSYAKGIISGSGDMAADRRANNDRSGIQRETHVRLYPWMRSLPFRLLLGTCIGVQRLFLGTDWGSGYVVVARRS